MEVNVAPPKKGEVRIRILYACPCHTDEVSVSALSVLNSQTYCSLLLRVGALRRLQQMSLWSGRSGITDFLCPSENVL